MHRPIINIFIWILAVLAMPAELFSQETISIMPLGNSITRGTMCLNDDILDCQMNTDADAVGYRKKLHELLSASGYDVDFIGKNSAGWGTGFTDTQHSGFDNMRTDQLAELFETGTISGVGAITLGPYMDHFPAQLILLHAGTNDVNQYHYSASPVAINRILDEIDEWETSSGLPALVFVARILHRRGSQCTTYDEYRQYNNSLATLVQSRISAGDNLVLVDMECDAGLHYYNDYADYLHPDLDGYENMAQVWFDYIDNYNTAPALSAIPDQASDRGTAFTQLDLRPYVSDAEDADTELSWSASPEPEHFTVSVDASVKLVITPKDPNWSGSEEITLVATDRGKVLTQLKKSASVNFTATVNWMPEITGQETLSTPEETAISLSVNDLVYVEPEKAPGDLSIMLSDGSEYSYSGSTVTPDENFNGNLSVPVRLSGGGKTSDAYMLSITVTPVNDKPVITGLASDLEVLQGSCLNILPEDLNIEDADNSDPADFTVLIQPGAYYNYSGNQVCPAPAFSGMLDVSLKVYDGSDQSDAATVQLKVLSLDPSFILPEAREVLQDELYDDVLEINHYAPGEFSYTTKEIPAWLSFNEATGQLSGTPSSADVGTDTLEFSISNGSQQADTSFTLTVINVNDPPVFITTELDPALTNVQYQFQVEVEDPDKEDVVLFEALEKPSWMAIGGTSGMINGIPSTSDTGNHEVHLRIFDGKVFVEESFVLEVQFYNHPPEFVSEPIDTATVGQTYIYGVRAVDFELQNLEYFAPTLPDWAELQTSNVLAGIPEQSDTGGHLVILGVSDGTDTTYQVFTIEVNTATWVEASPVAGLAIRVFPNPVEAVLTIEADGAALSEGPLHFRLMDLSGRTVMESMLYETVNTLILPDKVAAGAYLYLVQTTGGQAGASSGKLIKH